MNWEPIIVAGIAAFPPTLVAAAAYIQASRANSQSKATHLAVNSRMTELLEITRKAAADGATLAEKKAEHIRKGEAAVENAQPSSQK